MNDKKMPPKKPEIFTLTPGEKNIIDKLCVDLEKEFHNYDDSEFIKNLHYYSYKFLPERLIKFLNSFSTDFSPSQYGAVILKNLIDINDESVGPTPERWSVTNFEKIKKFGFLSALIHGSLPSKPVQYYAQRKGGGILHAIVPDKNKETSQTGAGSKTELFIHTEDSFLKSQADFLSLFYIRNEEQVPSTLYSIRSHEDISKFSLELFKPIFKFPKDSNFGKEHNEFTDISLSSVFYGNKKLPFMRFDAAEQLHNPHFKQSEEALCILESFWNSAKSLIYNEFIPEAGDLILVNNHICAHGRNAFEAGVKLVDGKRTSCQRRFMLRMMSKTSLINIREFTKTEDPYFVLEEHLGKNYKNK